MKGKRNRSPWLVQDLYLSESWGRTHYVSRRRHFDLRRFFVLAMVVFGAVDLALGVLFVSGALNPGSAPGIAGLDAVAGRIPTISGSVGLSGPTRFAVRASPAPTRRPPTARPPTQAPTAAPTAVPTKPPTKAPAKAAPRPTLVARSAPQAAPQAVPQAGKIGAPARTVAVALPDTLNRGALAVGVPPEPLDCTHAAQMPDVVNTSVKLCPGENYRPFTLRGENLGVFGDPSAVIRAQGHGFGIVVEGAHLLIQNVTIRATVEAGDGGTLLCLYPDCRGRPGGSAYGGGILVRASDTTVMNSDIAGGVSGVAAEHTSGLKLINNRLDNSSGWGSYNFAVQASYFVGNSVSGNNRSCVTPDGAYLPTGCESAGWVCIACQQNVIAKNFCTNSGDCFYINGEGNLQSNYNKFHQNECRASPHNCFEVTFSIGNEFVENIARNDPDSGAACKYPFWVGGSQVIFARNHWSCTISPEVALRHATDSTSVPTSIENR